MRPALHSTSLLTGAILALLGSNCAQAQTPAGGAYPYMGVGIGQARARIDAARLGQNAPNDGGLSITSTRRDERDTAYKLFGGVQLNRFIGVEAGYFRLGQFGYQALTSPTGELDGRLKVQGLSLDLVGSLPFSDRLSGQVRAGYQRARTRSDWSGSGAVSGLNGSSTRADDSAPRYGVGLQYAFTPQFFMRTDAERSHFADARGGTARATLYSVSVVLPFGRSSEPAPRVAYVAPEPPRALPEPPPVPVVVAPPPPVPPVAAPVPPPLRRVSFAAESLFGFDSAALSVAGGAALDRFSGELAGTRFDSITVTGHTDHLGSTAYNQKLSLQRADAVKAHLASSSGIDADRISTGGRGESEPVTQPGQCRGPKSPRLIACLQPDRRVEIQVSGSR